MDKPPDFWEVFAEALQFSAATRSWKAFVPWCLVLCLAGPPIAIYILSFKLDPKISDDGTIAVLSAVAVVAGFFGSISIATMGQVQRMVSEFPFSSFLREEKLFNHYLFWPQYTIIFQIGLLLLSVSAAILVRLIESDSCNKYFIAIDFGLLIYVCTKTWNLIDLTRKLTWHYEDYNRQSKEYDAQHPKVR